MNRKQVFLSIFVLLAVGTVIGVYAGTVGVNDLFGFDTITADVEYYRNGRNYTQLIASRYGSDQSLNTTDNVIFVSVNATDAYYLNSVNITETLYISQGSTATTGFNPALDYLPNYWVCDGAADNVQVQAATDYVNGLGGGGKVQMLSEDGTEYTFTDGVRLYNNIEVDGGGVTVNWNTPQGGNENGHAFYTQGARAGTSLLTADQGLGDNEITVADSTGFLEGNWLQLYTVNVEHNRNTKTGSTFRIADVTGNTITVYGNFKNKYTLAATATARIVTMVENPVLRNLRIQGTGLVIGVSAVGFYEAAGFTIENLEIENIPYQGIRLVNCVDGIVQNNYIVNASQTGLGYGITIANGCRDYLITANFIEGTRHAINHDTYNGYGQFGYPMDGTVSNNILTDNFGGDIDVHDGCGDDILFIGNKITQTKSGTPAAFVMGGRRASIIGNLIIGTTSTVGISDRGNELEELIIKDNIMRNVANGVYLDSTNLTYVDVSGDTYYNVSGSGVYVDAQATTTVRIDGINYVGSGKGDSNAVDMRTIGRVSVTNSKIGWAGRAGVYISGCSDSLISRNEVFNCDQEGSGGGTRQGIVLISSTNSTATFNHLYDDQGTATMESGITEVTSASGNVILDNSFDGLSNPATIIGLDTKLNEATFQFVFAQGGDAASSMAGGGIKIDAAGEYAYGSGSLPLDLDEAIFLKIRGAALGAPVNIGGNMHLDLEEAGAASPLEDYDIATKTFGVNNMDSTQVTYADKEVLHWRTSNSEMLLWTAGDHLQVQILHEIASDPDGETNAVFTTFTVEYV